MLHLKAHKQKLLLSPKQIDEVYKSLARAPFILTVTFYKILTNSLCTTSRIKNQATLRCFACGQGRDDLYHYLRCPCVAFIFHLPAMFGSIHKPYFSEANLARWAVFFEVYYILSRQYGITFLRNTFSHVAQKATVLAKHVAIKDKIQYLARITHMSDTRIHKFMQQRKDMLQSSTLDAAIV